MLRPLLGRVLVWVVVLAAFWLLWRNIQPPPVPPRAMQSMRDAVEHYQRLRRDRAGEEAPLPVPP